MGGGKNTKQKKNKRSSKVFSKIEEIYSKTQYLEEKKRLRGCLGGSSRISKKT